MKRNEGKKKYKKYKRKKEKLKTIGVQLKSEHLTIDNISNAPSSSKDVLGAKYNKNPLKITLKYKQ